MSCPAVMLAAPRVSVIVPVFNEPPSVVVQSLNSIAQQTMTDFECIVVDESTVAVTAECCRAFCAADTRFHYLHPERRVGLAASLNLGIAAARGELLVRFDSDDICVVDRLAMQLSFMDDHPDIDVLGGGLEIIADDETTLALRSYASDHAAIERRFQWLTAVAHPTVMIRADILRRHGGYDPTFRFAEDLDLWLRLLNRGARFANLEVVLVRYRQQHTRRHADHWRYNLKARRKNFSRRQLPRRLAGMCLLSLWSAVPAALQERIFAQMVLRRTHSERPTGQRP